MSVKNIFPPTLNDIFKDPEILELPRPLGAWGTSISWTRQPARTARICI